MDHPANPASQRATPPTAKEKNAVQRAVNALLDTLAPERATTRADRLPLRIEPHRTPSGCVLQAPTAAVSLSWFPDAGNGASLGELQIFLWRGVVSRRGSAPNPDGAVVVQEFALRPVDQAGTDCLWRTVDGEGATYTTDALAAYCLALLEEQMNADDPTGSAQATSARRRD